MLQGSNKTTTRVDIELDGLPIAFILLGTAIGFAADAPFTGLAFGLAAAIAYWTINRVRAARARSNLFGASKVNATEQKPAPTSETDGETR